MKRLLIFFSSVALLTGLANAQSVRLNDSSDWWSVNRKDAPRPRASEHELQPENFIVAGINLNSGGFEGIAAKLGQATIIERGDASTGRFQVCYDPATTNNVHLVFEFGEDESLFYLFAGGADWSGSKYCVRSKRVPSPLITASGLKIGLTRAAVKAILGRPDTVTANELVYSRQFHKKSTPEEFEAARKDYSMLLSDEEAHRKFDYYPVEQYVVARFSGQKLAYLAVSTSGTGD